MVEGKRGNSDEWSEWMDGTSSALARKGGADVTSRGVTLCSDTANVFSCDVKWDEMPVFETSKGTGTRAMDSQDCEDSE